MVELVIILPIALFLIGALIDFGIALQQAEKATDIARNSARTAAIVSFEDDFSAPPGEVLNKYHCPPVGETICSDPWDIQQEEDPCEGVQEDTIACLSFKEAKASIISSDLEPSDWKVSTRVCDVEVSNQLFPSIQVDIRRSAEASTCIMCFGDYLKASVSNARALFAVEGAC